MAFQSVPDVAQVRVEGRQDGQLTINDVYFAISGGGITPTNIAQLADAMDDWAAANLALKLSEDWSYTRVVAFDLTAADGPIAVASNPTTGAIASEAAPNNVAACISLRTAQRGRSGRGRNFIPGVPGNAVTLNTLSGPFMADIILAYENLIGAGTFLAGWQQVIVSRQTGGALRPTGLAIPVVSCEFTVPYVRSMRTREVGHGA